MKKSMFIFCLFVLLYFGIPVMLIFADDYTPVNHPPVAQDISFTTEKNTSITFVLQATDEDGDALTLTLQPPENGTAVMTADNEGVFSPADGFIGTIIFGYSVSDGYTVSVAMITATVIDSGIVEACVEDDSGQLDIAGSMGTPGGLVKVPVRINRAPNGISSFGFEIVYDTEMLSYKSYEKGALVENFDYFDARLISEGLIRCGGAKNNGIMSGASGSVLFLEFEIKQIEPATQLTIQELKDDMSGWRVSSGCFQGGCNGDINADGEITPMDALNSFEKYLGICPTSSNLACEDVCADVNKDGDSTPADTLCIFQYYLGLPNCLDENSAAPEAVASAYPTSGTAPLTVMFTAQYDVSLDGNRLKYEWDFQNDGQFDADGSEVSFTYSQQGTYIAVLQVTDQNGLTDTDEITIVVKPGTSEEKTVTIIASPFEGKAPLHVYFIADDHTSPIYLTQENVSGEDDTLSAHHDWNIMPPVQTKFDWDFDQDGKTDARGKEAFWYFREKGEYLVKVKATYEDGTVAIGETIIYVDEPEAYVPETIFIIAKPCIGPAPLETKLYISGRFVQDFLDHSTIEWDLDGDGQSDAKGKEISHTFTLEGEHLVTVSVVHENGEMLTATKTIIVKPEIIEQPPKIKISALPNTGIAPLDVRFSLTRNQLFSVDKNECRIQWDFDSDGIIDASGPFVSYVYQKVGEYVATCQITDIKGNVITDETIISVFGDDANTDPVLPQAKYSY
ncbi:MAG: PKD domain-containing protein [Candidatus Magnetomorum sp.]|nr:PKD domain-containing protein [Candidatus Magnetomorum sp.]